MGAINEQNKETTMNHRILSTAIAFILTLAVAMPAMAASSGNASQSETVSLAPSGDAEGLGMFEGELTLEHMGKRKARVTVTIRNLMSPIEGGYITGIALNNPYDQISSVKFASRNNQNFQVIGANRPYNAVKALPYGLFDFGVAVGGDFNLNNEYQLGLAPDMGSSVHTFVFNITGDDLDILSAQDFVNESSKRRGGEQIASFVVKFKGLNDNTEQTVAFNVIMAVV